MKKILLFYTILLISFALVFVLPYKQASANPVLVAGAAVPAGITIGAGAYTIGALTVAGIASGLGYVEYSEEINAHALRTWDSSTQLAKDSINFMINSAIGVGNDLTAVDAGFNTWMDTKIDSLGADAYFYSNITAFDQMGTIVKTSSNQVITVGGTTSPNLQMMYQGKNVKYISIAVGGSGTTFVNVNFTFSDNTTAWAGVENLSTALITSIKSKMISATTLSDFRAITALIGGIPVLYGSSAIPLNEANYNTGVSKVREAWESMKDAGLVLPVDSAIPVHQGNIATYNPQSDVYTGVDGGVIAKGDLTWSFPQPRIRTGEELDVAVPPGVYVDNPAGTYTPSLPTTAVPDIAIPTTTNITTGVTTEIPKTGTGEPPPTGGTTPKGEPVNPFNAKPIPIAALTGLFQLLAALIFYLIRMFTFIATIAFIQPTPIENPYFLWFVDATFYGIKPFPLVQNLALFFLGFSVYKSVRRVFG